MRAKEFESKSARFAFTTDSHPNSHARFSMKDALNRRTLNTALSPGVPVYSRGEAELRLTGLFVSFDKEQNRDSCKAEPTYCYSAEGLNTDGGKTQEMGCSHRNENISIVLTIILIVYSGRSPSCQTLNPRLSSHS